MKKKRRKICNKKYHIYLRIFFAAAAFYIAAERERGHLQNISLAQNSQNYITATSNDQLSGEGRRRYHSAKALSEAVVGIIKDKEIKFV